MQRCNTTYLPHILGPSFLNRAMNKRNEVAIDLPSLQNISLEEEARDVATLPPVDGGRDAWLALAGAFTLEALVWG